MDFCIAKVRLYHNAGHKTPKYGDFFWYSYGEVLSLRELNAFWPGKLLISYYLAILSIKRKYFKLSMAINSELKVQYRCQDHLTQWLAMIKSSV